VRRTDSVRFTPLACSTKASVSVASRIAEVGSIPAVAPTEVEGTSGLRIWSRGRDPESWTKPPASPKARGHRLAARCAGGADLLGPVQGQGTPGASARQWGGDARSMLSVTAFWSVDVGAKGPGGDIRARVSTKSAKTGLTGGLHAPWWRNFRGKAYEGCGDIAEIAGTSGRGDTRKQSVRISIEPDGQDRRGTREY